jgi:hypothetical protein
MACAGETPEKNCATMQATASRKTYALRLLADLSTVLIPILRVSSRCIA